MSQLLVQSLPLLVLIFGWGLYAEMRLPPGDRRRIQAGLTRAEHADTSGANVALSLGIVIAATLGWRSRMHLARWLGPVAYSVTAFLLAAVIALTGLDEISVAGVLVSVFVGGIFVVTVCLVRDLVILGLMRFASWAWGSALESVGRLQVWWVGRHALSAMMLAAFLATVAYLAAASNALGSQLRYLTEKLLLESGWAAAILGAHTRLVASLQPDAGALGHSDLYQAGRAGYEAVVMSSFAAPVGALAFIAGYAALFLLVIAFRALGARRLVEAMVYRPVGSAVGVGTFMAALVAGFN